MDRLRTLSTFEIKTSSSRKSRNSRRASKKSNLKERKNLSPSQIRDKIKNEEKGLSVKVEKSKGQRLGKGFMNEEELAKIELSKNALLNKSKESEKVKPAEEEEVVVGDVEDNNPNSSNTIEKLKTVLSTGAFSFNEKEKAALGQILNSP